MPKKLNENFEYFVSHCVMTEDCNPMGHSFLLISCIDHSKGKNARVEVLDAVGFYSTYGPIIGFKLKGPGRVKLEDPKYIVGRNGISHQTYQVTQEELGKLLTTINEDRRQNPILMRGEPKQYIGGPLFNAYRAHNCKNYVVKKLESIGVDPNKLNSFFQVPKLTKNHLTVTISDQIENRNEKEEVKSMYWRNLLVITPKSTKIVPIENEKIQKQEKFFIFYEGLLKIEKLLETRQAKLRLQNKRNQAIDEAIESIKNVRRRFETDQRYPNRLDDYYLKSMIRCVNNVVKKSAKKFFQEGKEVHLAHWLLDVLKETLKKLQCYFINDGLLKVEKANTIDKALMSKVENITLSKSSRVSAVA